MSELIPPDVIYVPWQVAIDFYIYAREGVITEENKYLLATPEREYVPELYEVLNTVLQELHHKGISSPTILKIAKTVWGSGNLLLAPDIYAMPRMI